ncbi:uncharacterized protein [Anoplolepis gracilipes]|uniref:uncharacterized protein n=1 Tax=Anoplolepis gracilipes TaxID=354296 RepID=UPI003BA03989
MEMTRDAKNITRHHNPFAIGIPSKQSVVLMSCDSSSDSLSKVQFCPTYRFCRELKEPYRLSMFDNDHDQQITTLHDLLQAIKESAIRLIQLIVNDIENRLMKRGPDSQMRYPEPGRYERNNQQHNESTLILATSSSVCALCGVALHLKSSSEKSEQFAFNRKRKEYDNRDYNIMLKAFNNPIFKMAPRKATLSSEKEKKQQEIISKTQSIDTSESGLKSKLLFIRRISSHKTTCQICRTKSQQKHDIAHVLRHIESEHEYNISEVSKPTNLRQKNSRIAYASSTISSTQDASTLTHEIFCPCACGLLVKDETESQVSIISLPVLKEKRIKTKELEELSFYLNSHQTVHTKMYDDKQKLKKDVNIEGWREEVIQLQLQAQVEELQKNIQLFKQENDYIRYLIEKCRCSLKIKFYQELLPITVTYSGLTSAIKRLQTKYNKNGIMATLIETFRGSINIQQIAGKLLTPFTEYGHQNSSRIVESRVPFALKDEKSSFEVVEVLNIYYITFR